MNIIFCCIVMPNKTYISTCLQDQSNGFSWICSFLRLQSTDSESDIAADHFLFCLTPLNTLFTQTLTPVCVTVMKSAQLNLDVPCWFNRLHSYFDSTLLVRRLTSPGGSIFIVCIQSQRILGFLAAVSIMPHLHKPGRGAK